MSNIRKTNTKFIRQTTPEAFSLFQTKMKKKIFKIKLLIDESILERILDFCDEKDIKKLNEQQYLVNFDFIDDDYSYGILLSLGHQCDTKSIIKPPLFIIQSDIPNYSD